MNDLPGMMLAMAVGLAMGAVYFGGLWLTLQRLPTSSSPGLLMAVSYIVRLGLILVSLYLVMDGRWERALAFMVGFTVVRIITSRRWAKEDKGKSASADGGAED